MKRLKTSITKKGTVLGLSDTFYFGKYSDSDFTLADLIDHDLSYITWCIKEVEFFKMDDEALEYYSDTVTRLIPQKKKRRILRHMRDNYHVVPAAFADTVLRKITHHHPLDDLNDEPFFGPEEVFGPNGPNNGWSL